MQASWKGGLVSEEGLGQRRSSGMRGKQFRGRKYQESEAGQIMAKSTSLLALLLSSLVFWASPDSNRFQGNLSVAQDS